MILKQQNGGASQTLIFGFSLFLKIATRLKESIDFNPANQQLLQLYRKDYYILNKTMLLDMIWKSRLK